MEYAGFIEENIHIIDQAIKCICRRHNLSAEEAEEFAAEARYKLIENDYKIVRDYILNTEKEYLSNPFKKIRLKSALKSFAIKVLNISKTRSLAKSIELRISQFQKK